MDYSTVEHGFQAESGVSDFSVVSKWSQSGQYGVLFARTVPIYWFLEQFLNLELAILL